MEVEQGPRTAVFAVLGVRNLNDAAHSDLEGQGQW
jgi:hypothetical protein